jgi:hypothetical protein
MSRRDDFRDIAKSVPFDNSSNGFTSTDTQAAIEEINSKILTSASPGFSFGRSGAVVAGAYLQCETVPSNVSGRWVYITSAFIKRVFVSNEDSTTFKIEILYHDGNESGITSIGTVTVTAAKGGAFSVNWAVPSNKQIAVRIATDSPNSVKNIVCGLELSGTSV